MGPEGPRGERGPSGAAGSPGLPGEPGEAATVTAGKATSGDELSVTNSGTKEAAIFDFVIPKGEQGPAGPGMLVPFSSGSSASLRASAGKAVRGFAIGFGYSSDQFTLTEYMGPDFSPIRDFEMGVDTRGFQTFTVPIDCTLTTIYGHFANTASFTPNRNADLYPCIHVARSPQDDNFFTLIEETVVRPSEPYRGGVYLRSNTTRHSMRDDLSIALMAGDRIAIVGTLEFEGSYTGLETHSMQMSGSILLQ